MTTAAVQGLFAAVLTPLTDDGRLDGATLAAHCIDLLEQGCHGVSLFGTTGEGPSFTVEERMAGLEAVLAAGVAPDRVLPGTGCAALADTIRLSRHAVERGCTNVLVMPPFFFKEVSDDGVFRAYADLAEGVGGADLRVYIYNFPAVTGVRVSPAVVGRLLKAHPRTFAGVKDSSGDWDYVIALLRLSAPGFAVFTGHETLLPRLLGLGGKGNISGVANVIPGLMRRLHDARPASPADPLLAAVADIVDAIVKHPVTPALKALIAHQQDRPAWRNVRPPLVALDAKVERAVVGAVTRMIEKAGA